MLAPTAARPPIERICGKRRFRVLDLNPNPRVLGKDFRVSEREGAENVLEKLVLVAAAIAEG